MVHHDPRRRVEPVDQQAAGIVDRIVDRAADVGAAAGAEPAGGGVEQGMGRLPIVDAFEHAEAADVAAVAFVVARIVADQDSAQRLPAAQGDELRGVAVLVERMLAAVEKFLDLDQQGRNPMRIVRVDPPRHVG